MLQRGKLHNKHRALLVQALIPGVGEEVALTLGRNLLEAGGHDILQVNACYFGGNILLVRPDEVVCRDRAFQILRAGRVHCMARWQLSHGSYNPVGKTRLTKRHITHICTVHMVHAVQQTSFCKGSTRTTSRDTPQFRTVEWVLCVCICKRQRLLLLEEHMLRCLPCIPEVLSSVTIQQLLRIFSLMEDNEHTSLQTANSTTVSTVNTCAVHCMARLVS